MTKQQQFIWHDGGRASAGFVGFAGDCVVRAIAIATGKNYREIYDRLFQESGETPRNGVSHKVSSKILKDEGFSQVILNSPLPFYLVKPMIQGVAVVSLIRGFHIGRGHLCALVDGTVYDTWDATQDIRFVVDQYWTAPSSYSSSFEIIPSTRRISKRQLANNDAMARVIERIRKMRNTAGNSASTEGEIENALRMASTMMLKYQLTEEDIQDQAQETNSAYGSIRLAVTGSRATSWEKSLAAYVCELCSDVFWYYDSNKRSTEFVFYGPIDSVESAVELFKELMLEIAVMAKLKYGGFARGSGASYAEGFVAGLEEMLTSAINQQPGLIESKARQLARFNKAALKWLRDECDISLSSSACYSRSGFDPSAAEAGKSDGRSRVVTKPGRLRIEQK